MVNTGDLIEFQQEEEPDLNQGDSFYETPNGNVYTEGDLISQYGMDDFNSYVEGGNYNDATWYAGGNMKNTDLALEALNDPFLRGLTQVKLIIFKEHLVMY